MLGLINVVTGNLLGGLWWFLIGLFVRAASSMALQATVSRSVFAGRPVSHFMRRDPITVAPDLPVAQLVNDYVYRHYFKSFPVTEGDRLVGCVTINDVKATEREHWPTRRVRDIMQPCSEANTVPPETDAAQTLARMRQTGNSRLLVRRGDRLVGIVALRDLLDFLSLREDLGPQDAARGAGLDARSATPHQRLHHG